MQCLRPIRVHIGTPSECLVPCGKCGICRQNYRNMWITRLKSENFTADYSFFITLTFDDDNLQYKEYVDIETGEIIKKPFSDIKQLQLFLKRLRKLYPEQIRYFAVSEYGEKTLRPHWHMLLFIYTKNFDQKKFYDDVTNTWQKGILYFGSCTDASITYVSKYILKISRMPLGIKDTRMLCSRRPAIGSYYILNRRDYVLKSGNFAQLHMYGQTAAMPRLFRDKFKSEYYNEHSEAELANKRSISYLIEERDRKLKEEFEKSNFEDFSLFLQWKSTQYDERQKVNVVKHDKI